MKSFDERNEKCPSCGSTGNCSKFASYERNLIDFIAGKTVYHRISILRVRCSGCGSTHSILPDMIIPYSTYGLFFILRVLAEHFSKRLTVGKICKKYSIEPPTLYRWKKIFLKHREDWLGLLESLETSAFQFIYDISSLNQASDFLLGFFQKAGISFLQNHKNPARSYRSQSPP